MARPFGKVTKAFSIQGWRMLTAARETRLSLDREINAHGYVYRRRQCPIPGRRPFCASNARLCPCCRRLQKMLRPACPIAVCALSTVAALGHMRHQLKCHWLFCSHQSVCQHHSSLVRTEIARSINQVPRSEWLHPITT
jgi:hypothetical protein